MLKTQQDRNQIQMWCLDAAIDKESIVRVVDAFVDLLDLEEIGFVVKGKIKNGAPAYHASDLLKLYYYGYLNRTRSSRRLEREAITNLEAIWLIKGARPGYKTIANFRKDNLKALKKVFRIFNRFLLEEDLLDKEVVAIDGSKFQGQNSTKNNYNERKVDQHLERIAKQTTEYLEEMDRLDQTEIETEIEIEQRMEISEKLNHLQERKKKYEGLSEQVQEARAAGHTQVSTVDPDARALPKRMNVVQVGYNVLTAAGVKNKFITNYKVENQLDTYLLSEVAKETKALLKLKEADSLTVLADKGFDTGSELKACSENNITTIVAVKKRLSNKKDKRFAKTEFRYDEERNEYRCPLNHPLRTNGTWYSKKAYNQHRAEYQFQRFTCSYKICSQCEYKEACVGAQLKSRRGRVIERSDSESYIEENAARYQVHKELYRERQATVEHQFGIIKRQWGFDYTLLRTKEKVSAEFAIIFTCYNLRRSVSILGASELIKRLKVALSFITSEIQLFLSCFKRIFLNSKYRLISAS